METIHWHVDFTTSPKALRHCKKCGVKAEFISSDMFRVNANQKKLDVWLIYRCSKCKSTWNSTILTRVNPKRLSPDLLKGFHNNSPELAFSYSMDFETLKCNGAEMAEPKYEVTGKNLTSAEEIKIEIHCKYPTKIKLSKILREKLSLSRKEFDRLADKGKIIMENGSDIQKARLEYKSVIILNSKI